jgi:hypothetical protein
MTMYPVSFRVLLLLVIFAVVFLVATSNALPPVVASHFGLGGVANGFMTRAAYMAIMAGVMIIVPLLLPAAFVLMRYAPPSMINLPNREFWLAPERNEATFNYLSGHGGWFGCSTLIFLAFVHYLVVEANEGQPPRLAENSLWVGLALFMLTTLAWSVSLIAHFRRILPEQVI